MVEMVKVMEIKPCPSCGGKDVRIKSEYDMSGNGWHFVYCDSCTVEGQCVKNNKQKAIEMWNAAKR